MRNRMQIEDKIKEVTIRAEKEKAKFIKSFEEDAAYALSWSHNYFATAAEEKIWKEISFIETNNKRLGDESICLLLIKISGYRVQEMAMYPAQSTSSTSNLMVQGELSAWAKALSFLADK